MLDPFTTFDQKATKKPIEKAFLSTGEAPPSPFHFLEQRKRSALDDITILIVRTVPPPTDDMDPTVTQRP